MFRRGIKWTIAILILGTIATANEQSPDEESAVYRVKNVRTFPKVVPNGSDALCSILLHPDGESLIAAGNRSIIVTDLKSAKVRTFFKTNDTETGGRSVDGQVSLCRKGERLATIWSDTEVVTFDVNVLARQVVLRSPHQDDAIMAVAIAPAGDEIVTGDTAGNLIVWDCGAQQIKQQLRLDPAEFIFSICYSPDGKLFAVGSRSGIWLSDARSDGPIHKLRKISDEPVGRIVFAPNGDYIAAAEQDNITLWDVKSGEGKQTIPLNGFVALFISISQDNRTIVAGGGGPGRYPSVQIIDTGLGKVVTKCIVSEPVVAVQFSKDPDLFVTGSMFGTVKIWKVERRLVKTGLNAE